MDSKLITISNILPQTNRTDLSSSGLGVGKGSQKFFIDQDYEPNQTVLADKNVDNNTSKAELRSGEDVSTSKETNRAWNSNKSIKKDIHEENNDKNYSIPDNESPVKSPESQDNGNIESKSASGSSEIINKSDDAISGETIHSEQKSEIPDGLQVLVSEQSRGTFGIAIKKTNINGDAENIQVDGQVKNNDGSPAQNGLTNVSKTLLEWQNNTIKQSELVIEKESIVGNRDNALVTDEKIPVLSSELVKENAKELLSKTKSGETDIKELLSAEKSLDNRQSYVSQEVLESPKIKESINYLNGLKSDSAGQKIDITNIQVSTGQTKSHNESSSDNKTTLHVDQIASQNTFVTEQNINSISNTKAVSQEQPDVSENVSKQILESIHSSINKQGGDKQITVNLNPPELGQVSIKFQENGTELNGLLEVNKAQTRSEIEQALPQIIRNLSDSGINIKRLEVVLTNDGQTGQEEMKEESLLYNQQQQQDFNNPGMHRGSRDTTKFHEWMTNQIDSVNNQGFGDSVAVESSINILI